MRTSARATTRPTLRSFATLFPAVLGYCSDFVWLQPEEEDAAEVDARLWEGAAASGWKLGAQVEDGEDAGQWELISPAGKAYSSAEYVRARWARGRSPPAPKRHKAAASKPASAATAGKKGQDALGKAQSEAAEETVASVVDVGVAVRVLKAGAHEHALGRVISKGNGYFEVKMTSGERLTD